MSFKPYGLSFRKKRDFSAQFGPGGAVCRLAFHLFKDETF